MKLVIEDETGTRSVLPLAGGEITVGRAAEGNRFRLTDRDVSRRHARFLLVNGVPYVEDLGSLTGTRVNGERISGRRRLREGDLVEIGDYDLAVIPEESLAAVAGPGAPPPLPGEAPIAPSAAVPAAAPTLPRAPAAAPARASVPAPARAPDPAPARAPAPTPARALDATPARAPVTAAPRAEAPAPPAATPAPAPVRPAAARPAPAADRRFLLACVGVFFLALVAGLVLGMLTR